MGEDWEAIHVEWLNTIGNLTLTGYNSELSNSDYPTKKAKLLGSHVELNKYFSAVDIWDEQAIALRGEVAADMAVKIWPDFTLGADGSEVVVEELQEDVKLLVIRVVDHFGGEVAKLGKGSRIFYKTGDGKVINVKYSKRHSDYYWFGFHASLWDDIVKDKVTHVVFVMVPDGFVTLPVAIVKKYISQAGFSPKSDGTVRHYHVLISFDPNPEHFHHGKSERIALKKYYTAFA